MRRLGEPQAQIPAIHVAGTNGKGSTIAFMRAILEAFGRSVHVYTSPHLVRFNERFRIAGKLVSDAELEAALEECERANAGEPVTFNTLHERLPEPLAATEAPATTEAALAGVELAKARIAEFSKTPTDLGLTEAIKSERYEDAARYRDEIQQVIKPGL